MLQNKSCVWETTPMSDFEERRRGEEGKEISSSMGASKVGRMCGLPQI